MEIKLTAEQRKKIHLRELDVLIEFDRICHKYHIKYTLAGGTMIGAIRHKGFIPWDDDIDIYVLRSDFNRLRKICPKELSKKFFYQCNVTDKEYYYPFDKIRVNNTLFESPTLANRDINHGLFIDIFPIDIIPDNKILSNIQFYNYRIVRAILLSKYINIDSISGLKKIAAKIIKIMTLGISLDKLYALEESIAQKYSNETNFKTIRNLNSLGSDGKKETYLKEDLTKTIVTNFEGYKFQVSANYDEMLRKIYGNYMQLPPKSKRNTRHELLKFKL